MADRRQNLTFHAVLPVRDMGVNWEKFAFASPIDPPGSSAEMRILEADPRFYISYKLPGYASSTCLVTTLLGSKVLEDPEMFSQKQN